ncbi:MAG: hypothetical protein MZW92_10075 [Comamonadaceae bacterium]|nr:hypothetical protein [Comamonadaceae bacterium]
MPPAGPAVLPACASSCRRPWPSPCSSFPLPRPHSRLRGTPPRAQARHHPRADQRRRRASWPNTTPTRRAGRMTLGRGAAGGGRAHPGPALRQRGQGLLLDHRPATSG